MGKKATLWLFLFFSALSFLRLASSSRSLSTITDQAKYLSDSGLYEEFQVALKQRKRIDQETELFVERRMDIETRDYSGTGANNHHDPRPPGRS